MFCDGFKPRKLNIKKRKNGQYSTQKIYKLFNEIRDKINDSIINCDVQFNENYENSNEIKQSILYYLRINGEYNTNPQLIQSLNWNNEQQRITITNQKELIKIYNIENHKHIPSLNNEKGLIAQENIQAFTVLGQYLGNESLYDEWDYAFKYTKLESIHNCFSFDISIKHKHKEYYVIIDATDYNKDNNLLVYVNDCRKNIFNKEITENDKNALNSRFILTKVNNWGMIFLVATKEIKKDSEILTNYGSTYCDCMKSKERYLKNIKEMNKRCKNIIDSN